MTPTAILTARRRAGGVGGTVTIECECTKSDPNRPDCKPQSTTSGSKTTVNCVKSGGCKTCKTSISTTTTGVVIA